MAEAWDSLKRSLHVPQRMAAKDEEGKKSAKKKAVMSGHDEGERWACPWDGKSFPSSKSLQGHLIGAHLSPGSPGGGEASTSPNVKAALKEGRLNLEEENRVLREMLKQRESYARLGLGDQGGGLRETISDAIALETLKAMKANPNPAPQPASPEISDLRAEVRDLRDALAKEEFRNLAASLGEKFSERFVDLEKRIGEGRSRSAKDEVQVESVATLGKAFLKGQDRWGARIDQSLQLIVAHLRPQAPGELVEEPPLSEEAYAAMAERLDGGLEETRGTQPEEPEAKPPRQFKVAGED